MYLLFALSFSQVIQYQEQSDLALMLLVKSQQLDKPFKFRELMKFCLTPIPHSLDTPDGFFNKTNKATMLHYLLNDVPDNVQYPSDSIFIQDGNALFHALVNLPATFEGICMKILDQMVVKKNFICSTDSYQIDC